MNIIQGKLNFLSLFKRNLIYRFKSKINIDHHTDVNDESLESLCSYYNSDKATYHHYNNANEKEKSHGYTKFYEKHLNSIKNNKINILEIGSYKGSSAAAFAKYFSNAQIFCLDINLRNFKYSSKRIHAFGLDVSSQNMTNKFLKKIDFFTKIKSFDVIIDDGSHALKDILIALNFFYRYVRKEGFYIIEDYKFPNYFDHLNDVNDIKIDEMINKININELFASKIIENNNINLLLNKKNNIFSYKGDTSVSDIVFFQKNVN